MRYGLRSGAALDYSTGGVGDTTLVMLHPIGLQGAMWNGVASELAGEFRSIAIDLPGHGGSDVLPERQSIEDMAEAVAELVHAIGGERNVLVGCSMGSAVAAAVAAKGDPKIVGLVLSNSSNGQGPERYRSMSARADAARRGMPGVLDTTMRRWFSDEILATRLELTGPVERWLLDADPIVHCRSWEALRDFDFTASISKLVVPVLVIAATLDQSVSTAAAQALAKAAPGAEYREIAGAGHLSPWERPRDYAALLRAFLGADPSIHA